MAGKINYSARLGFVLIVVIGSGQVQCGGRQPPAIAPCDDGYNKILEKKDDEICEPAHMNLFEIQVTKWRDDCPSQAQGLLGKKVTDKLIAAQECSDKKRRVEMMRNDCALRLEEVVTGSLSCLGEDCVPYWDDLNGVAKICDIPELEGAFTDKIGSLKAQLDERSKDADRLRALSRLIVLCDQFVEIADEKQGQSIFDQILQEVSATPPMKEVPKVGSEVERYRQGVQESCDQALVVSVEVLIPAISKKLDDKKNAGSSRRWNREFNKLISMRKRLLATDGAILFPKALDPLETSVRKYDPAGDKVPDTAPSSPAPSSPVAKGSAPSDPAPSSPAPSSSPVPASPDKKEKTATPETNSTPTAKTGTPSSGKEVAASSAPPAAEDRQQPKKNEEQCKELKNKAAHFSAKVAEYQKKGNENKSKAYQAKLDKANQSLEGCTAK